MVKGYCVPKEIEDYLLKKRSEMILRIVKEKYEKHKSEYGVHYPPNLGLGKMIINELEKKALEKEK